jgi:hypothetical protein
VRYELSDREWDARVDDRRVLNGIFLVLNRSSTKSGNVGSATDMTNCSRLSGLHQTCINPHLAPD